MTNLHTGVIVQVGIKLDLMDRLRVLVGKTIHFQTGIGTEMDAGKTKVDWEHVHVDHILPQKAQTATPKS